MKKYLKNTQEEDESGTSGQTAHQTSRNRSAETEKLMKLASIEGVFEIPRSWKLRSRVNDRRPPRGLQRREHHLRTNDVTTDTNTEMELETDADTESTAQDNREPKTTVQKTERKRENVWQEVLSKKEKKKQAKERLPKQPANKSRPEPKRKQPRKFIRPDALIIRPAEKAKYVEILRRIKKDVPQDQTRDVVDKVQKTSNGNMLITLSRKSADKGQALLKTIQSSLKEEAQVICKGPEEQLEIRDIDEETTKNDVREALQEAAGDDYKIPEEVIKIRPAYRGTQTASVRLPAATAQKILGEKGKIRIGWVNCRIRAVKTPLRCYKCWHFGHTTVQCKSEVNRSGLCIKCGQTGYRSSVWFWSMPGLPRSTTEADEQTNMKILQLNINHCEAAHDLLMQTVRELQVDLVILSEPYKHLAGQPWGRMSPPKQ
ncbi:hypothetical protein EVAR_25495_1 [Eumeta japonica]|uniref:CCHC-type domain-containing protein n=1 Tax=Eumeta variegata TaxID=151549 RepID=A0A4C1VM34_EUMVA|nr:hypothetical protein EVAR_25495_1 [Eumeta japonica]